MAFGWKVLVPVSLLWILVVAAVRTVQREYELSNVAWLGGIGAVLLVVLALSLLVPERKKPPVDASKPVYPDAFPVPPMDLRVPPSPRLRVAAGEKIPVTVPAAAPTDTPASGEE
jgi:NADH-quinone oxidoreductase subunit H